VVPNKMVAILSRGEGDSVAQAGTVHVYIYDIE
jgi:hypothetical protein